MNKQLDYGKKMPICLRKYERGNVECDGRPGAKSKDERVPCVYRDRCVALQKLIRVKNISVKSLLKLRKIKDVDGARRVYSFSIGDSEKFQQWLARIIDRYGIVNGRITIRHPKEEKPRKKRKFVERSEDAKKKSIKALVKARQYAAKKHAEKACESFDSTKDVLAWFVKQFQAVMGTTIILNDSNVKRMGIGEYFFVNRVKTTKYVTLYIQGKKLANRGRSVVYVKKRIPITRIVLSTSVRGLQFKTTMDVDTFESIIPKASKKKLKVFPFNEGRYRSKTNSVGKEGVSVFVEILKKAIDNRIIIPNSIEI